MPVKNITLAYSEEEYQEMVSRKGDKSWNKLFYDAVMRLPVCDSQKA